MDPKELLEQWLSKVGWTLFHIGCEHYVLVNAKGERSGLEYHNGYVLNTNSHEMAVSMCFAVSHCKFEYKQETRTVSMFTPKSLAWLTFFDWKD